MAGSAKRILTSHAGSLPRLRALVDLDARRSRGDKIDEVELQRPGEKATYRVVEQQKNAGIDVPSDGEQVGEAFFLYVQRRMSGFGANWNRPAGSELAAYPDRGAPAGAGL